MKSSIKILFITFLPILLAGCQQAANGNQPSFFQSIFVSPFEQLIHLFSELTGGSFGLAIIMITLLVRFVLMPFMLKQYKNQQDMKEKMDRVKPEMETIQKRMKETKNQKEQQKLQQEMMALYQKHGINPLNMGCLPILIQMPILMGLYYAISGSEEIAAHSFLWFSLGQPDIWMTAAAGIIYYLQFRVSMSNLPEQQQKQMKLMGLMSPAMIVIISLNAPAALPLYWTVGGCFLIIQTYFSRKNYQKENTVKASIEEA